MPLRDRVTAARRSLDSNLFRPSAGGATAGARGERAGLAVALLALAIVAQLARPGWTASLDSLWAEDGAIFLNDALREGFAEALVSEYSGYLVLVPRLIGEAASAFPLLDAPAVVSILSAAVVAVTGLVVWEASSSHLENPFLRGTLAVMTVLTPIGGLETIGSAANVSWYMLVGVFWLLLWRPATFRGALLAALFIALAGLSNPGIWFFLPLAALRAFAVRDRRDLAIVVAFFGAGLVQLASLALTSYEAVDPVWTSDVWTVLLQRVVAGAVLGLRLGGEAWVELGWPFLIAITAAFAGALIAGFATTDRRGRWIAAIAVPIALAMFVLSVYQRAVATPMLWPAGVWGGQAGRYAIVPAMLLIAVLFVFIDRPKRRRAEWAGGDWLLAGIVALLLVSTAASFPSEDLAARGTPTWEASVEAAAAQCAAEPAAAEVALPISPPGFGMQLPCAAIPAGR